jgi:PTS system nitrogen regulatory IIA component
MQLTVQNVAELLNVSEKTVYRWISDGSLPGYRVSGQYRFNRAEVLEWATSHKIHVSPKIFEEPQSAAPLPGLYEALQAGGVHYRVGGTDRASALQCVVEALSMPHEVDRKFLFDVLLAREGLASTGVGDGIAIPHVRSPLVLHVDKPIIGLCFMETPVEFGALDGKPVHALFTLISPTVRGHLHLLSRLAYALHDEKLKDAVRQHALRDDIFREIRRIEEGLPRK